MGKSFCNYGLETLCAEKKVSYDFKKPAVQTPNKVASYLYGRTVSVCFCLFLCRSFAFGISMSLCMVCLCVYVCVCVCLRLFVLILLLIYVYMFQAIFSPSFSFFDHEVKLDDDASEPEKEQLPHTTLGKDVCV